MVPEPRLLVPLHPRVAVALRWDVDLAVDQSICARPVGVVLLVRDDRARLGHLCRCRAEVVAQLKAPASRGAPNEIAVVAGAALDEDDAPGGVAGVPRLPLSFERTVAALAVER